jgi:hypothetical protein
MTEHQSSRQLPWLIALASGFIVALAALLAPAGAPDIELPARVALGLPTPLIAVVLLVLVIVEFVMLGFVLFSGRRRRKRKEADEFELYHEHPPVSPWLGALLLVWTLLLVVATVYLVRHGVPPLVQWPSGRGAPPPGVETPPSVVAPGVERPFVSMPVLTWSIAAVATLVAAGGVGLLLWLFLGHRLGRSHGSAAEPAPFLAEAVDESLDDLRREHDARVAIVKCYRRFEQTMARARVPRQPWETPVEYMHAALTRLALPGPAVQALTDLFEIARFSDHPVGAAEHEAAWTCLTEIRDWLQRRADAVAT